MPAITEDISYELCSTERIKELNQYLGQELSELRNELEENEMVHGISRAVSSVPLPKDPDHFKKERELVLNKALQVSEAKKLVIQSERMERELNTCFDSDYKPDGLPLLLHQYFIDRMHELVQCKHMHMLRWRRFCEHTSTIEALEPYYRGRLAHIMSEYNDCVARAQRLSVAREMFLAGKPGEATIFVKQDDILIYLRWLVCHFHSMKKFNQYMRVLQWLPVVHKHKVSPKESENNDDDSCMSVRIPAKYDDDYLDRPPSSNSATGSRSNLSSSRSRIGDSAAPTPPPFNALLQTSNAVNSQQAGTAAARGGGLATDENGLNIPLTMNNLDMLRPLLSYLTHLYGIDVNVEKLSNTADEMELYAAVNRRFKQVFNRQEHMKTFKTYDRVEPGLNWGADHSIHALKKQANWLPYVTLKPEKDPKLENKMVELRYKNNVDELLRVMARFTCVNDPEKVHEALRTHTSSVRHPSHVEAVSVTTHRHGSSTKAIWKKIYTNPDLYNDEKDAIDIALEEFDEKDTDKVSFDKKSRAQSGRKRKDSFDYFNTVQLLGLDDGEQDSNDPSSIQGGFLSYLQLRHLRIRDLQRTCLGVLNYFRSVERMITIYDGGLSLEPDRVKQTSPQNHRKGIHDGVVGGGGLGSHAYMHYKPSDFKVSETEFMEFAEVDNHDDFYCMEEGRIHVQDQRGYYIVYDAAVDDVKELEKDLLLICTHFIEKDRELRNATGVSRSDSARRQRGQSQAGDFDIPNYGHQDVDRFGVLMDVWAQEAAFLECKKELMDCYIEAYQHVFDRDEKRLLAQVITNLMHKRPRYDFNCSYFVRAYRLECICLRLRTHLLKDVLDTQIREQREYIQKVCRDGNNDFGLPYAIIPKQPISINMSSSEWSEDTMPRSALHNVYMMEFHPSLAIANKIPEGLKHAYWELYHSHKPETMTDCILLEKNMLENALHDWHNLPPLGGSYSSQNQKDIFGDVFVEDPLFICEIAQTQIHQQEQDLARKNQREKAEATSRTLGQVLQLVTSRHRLIAAAWETEVLSKIYKKMAVAMGYDECHLFMRSIQFEFANKKNDAGKPPPLFITSLQEDDSAVDRLVPKNLCLAVHELDEGHVGNISFRSRDKILQILKGGGAENLSSIVACQVLHKNALVCAVQQGSLCQPVKDRKIWNRSSSPDTKSEKSSATQLTGMSSATAATGMGSRVGSRSKQNNKHAPEAFLSIQMEKTPSRDVMLNKFVAKKAAMGTALRIQDKVIEVKRELVNEFCTAFMQRLSQYSLRGQIIAYYNSILGLLDDFPNIRDTYFILGDANEKKGNLDTLEGIDADPRTLRKRPRRVLTEDGKHLLNLWFIPHYTELLIMYKHQDDCACKNALLRHVKIISMLHDILQYLCAHAKLGSSHARLGTKKIDFVSADWGGTEGVGADLREIQKQVDHLDNKENPDQVATFLSLRRDVMFMEFETAVRFNLKDTFLACGNKNAFKAISAGMHYGLHQLSNAHESCFNAMYFSVPEPLEARDPHAMLMYPWREFINREGPYAVHFWQWQQIEHNMQMCLAGLKEVERHVANGEILGVSLLMEDVLTSGRQDKTLMTSGSDVESSDDDTDGDSVMASSTRASSRTSRHGSFASERRKSKFYDPFQKKSLSRTHQPIDSYTLLKSFLLLWKRLEHFKTNWGKNKLGVQEINSTRIYNVFCKEYKKDVLYTVLVSLARRHGQSDMYEGMVSDLEQLVMPKGATEMEIRVRQVMKLLELHEYQMIMEVRKKLQKETSLALSERTREESALPIDLWKKGCIKESFTTNRPHIAENFITILMSDCRDATGDVTFNKEHLNKCLNQLASEIMIREKENYINYSTYYENLLRVSHQLLYQKEQEVKQVKDQLRNARESTLTEVQCELADTSQSLLLEITALRAKIAEMREQSLKQEMDIREKVREEYDALVQNIFSSAFDIKRKFDEYRDELHDNVFEKIAETRREALEEMKRRFGSEEDDIQDNREVRRYEELRGLQQDNYGLNTLLMKMKFMNTWKISHETGIRVKLISDLKRRAERSRKQYLELRMTAEEEVILLRQQLFSVREALRMSKKECDELKEGLEEEMKAKKEKTHLAQQRAQNQKQLEEARRANIEKLIEELGDKESKLRQLSDDQDRAKRLQHLQTGKAKKDVATVKKKLNHERGLKLDAFQRVDELQTQMYDIESVLQSIAGSSPTTPALMPVPAATRPHTATGAMRTKARLNSAKLQPSAVSRGATPGPRAPMGTPWPSNRSPTPVLMTEVPSYSMEGAAAASKKIQRPKTTTGRLRNRLADQLLNELDPPDHHETILKLKELQAMKAEKVLF